MIVIPSPFTASAQELRAFIAKAEGRIEIFQVDIDDGSFLANRTVLPENLRDIKTNLKLDFHLMVKEPVDWIERCIGAGGSRLIGQVEYMSSQEMFVQKCRGMEKEVGLALDINTKVAAVNPRLLSLLDVILLMDYPAGKGGQPFDERVLEKVQALSDLKKKAGLSFRICCDGGIGEDTIKRVAEAGADEVTVGRPLFEGEIKDNMDKLLSYL